MRVPRHPGDYCEFRYHRNLTELCEKADRGRFSLASRRPFAIIRFGNFGESIRDHEISYDNAPRTHTGQNDAEFGELIVVARGGIVDKQIDGSQLFEKPR